MSDFHPGALLNAVVYAALGILIFMLALCGSIMPVFLQGGNHR